MTTNEHLDGGTLEALAHGEQPLHAQAAENHLRNCAQCRNAVEAMRHESKIFSAELAPGIGAKRTALRPSMLYAAAALLMLGVALALVWSAQTARVPEAKTVTAGGDEKPQALAQDQPPPKPAVNPPVTPPAEGLKEPVVYEGKSAAEWVAVLVHEGKAPDGEEARHATQALVAIGVDAMPELLRALEKSKDAGAIKAIGATLVKITPNADSLPALEALLKSDSFECRRGAVRLLGRLAAQDKNDRVRDAARRAIVSAMKDRDRAVVEAAKETLANDPRTRALQLLELAQKAEDKQDAITMVLQALALDPDNEEAKKLRVSLEDAIRHEKLRLLQEARAKDRMDMVKTMLAQAEISWKSGKLEEAATMVQRVLVEDQHNAEAKALLDKIEAERKQKASSTKGSGTIGEAAIDGIRSNPPRPSTKGSGKVGEQSIDD